MMVECIICSKQFSFTYSFQKNINYIPKVCNSNCFLELLHRDYKHVKDLDLGNIQNMKSGYERAIAIWLYKNNLFFKYEPFIYKNYIPDFLVGENIILEIKGIWEGNYYSKFKKFYTNCCKDFKIYLIDYEFLKRIKCKPLKIGESYELNRRN